MLRFSLVFDQSAHLQQAQKLNNHITSIPAQGVTTAGIASASKFGTYLEKNFSFSKLEVSISQHSNTNLIRRRSAVFSMRWFNTTGKNTVSVDKLGECVPDWITSTTDTDRFHHSGIAQLSHAQRTIEYLRTAQHITLLVQRTWVTSRQKSLISSRLILSQL
jgi:hypothetical protein